MAKRPKFKKRLQLIVGLVILVVALIGVGLYYYLTKGDGGQKNADVTATATATASIKVVPEKTTVAVNERFKVDVLISGGGQEYTSFKAEDVTLTNLVAKQIDVIQGPATEAEFNALPSGEFMSWAMSFGAPTLTKLSFAGGVKNSRTPDKPDLKIYTVYLEAQNPGPASINVINGQINQISGSTSTNIITSPNSTTSLTVSYPPSTITSVQTSKTSGYYTAGTVIDFKVTFSDVVIVSGSPYLSLNALTSAGVNAKATYPPTGGGSGTNTLTFNYTVAAGDKMLTKLDYLGTGALSLNGGTIKDSHTQAPTFAMPSVGISGSKTIVIDTAKPVISALATTNSTIFNNVPYIQNATVTDDTPMTYKWESVGANAISFDSSTAKSTTITATYAGSSRIKFSATDSAGNTDYKELAVTVRFIGDIDGNLNVGFGDFEQLLSDWTSTAKPTPSNRLSDVNNDAYVNFKDFELLLNYWGKG